MAGTYETFFGPENRVVTMKLLMYSLLMISLPIGTYFFLLHIVFGSNKNMAGWSGIGAVFMVNMVIVAYVVMAWTEPNDADVDYVYVDDGEGHENVAEEPLLKENAESGKLRQRVTAVTFSAEEESKVDRIRSRTEGGHGSSSAVKMNTNETKAD